MKTLNVVPFQSVFVHSNYGRFIDFAASIVVSFALVRQYVVCKLRNFCAFIFSLRSRRRKG